MRQGSLQHLQAPFQHRQASLQQIVPLSLTLIDEAGSQAQSDVHCESDRANSVACGALMLHPLFSESGSTEALHK